MVGTVHKISGKWYVYPWYESPEGNLKLEITSYPVCGEDILALDILYPDSMGSEVRYELFTAVDPETNKKESIAKIYKIYDKQAAYVPTITEEDIDKAAWKFNPRPSLDVEFIREGFREGAKWAIEQINKK